MKESKRGNFSIAFRIIPKTFKTIADVENERTEFKELNIIEAILAALIYLAFNIFAFAAMAISKNIISVSLIIVMFFVVINMYNRYIVKSDKVVGSTIKVYLRNIAFVISLFSGYLLIIYSLVFPFIKMLKIYNPLIDTFNKSAVQSSLFLLAFVFIVPILEEFVFRGVILGGLLKKYSSRTAILVSSILFGALHLNIFQFIIGFCLGLLIGYVYIKTHSICICMLIHVLNDTLSSLPNYYYHEYAQLVGSNIVNIILFTVIGSIIIFIGFKGLIYNVSSSKMHKNITID